MIRSQNFELIHNVVGEFQEMRDGEGCPATADIDMVWVLSAPGTVTQAANDGIYSGASFDRMNVDKGIQTVYEVTGLRLGKAPERVTRADVAAAGPVLFYNGEDENTENAKYAQNQHLADWAGTPDFPIPPSKLIIDTIPTISTPPQVQGLAAYLQHNPSVEAHKIAVVSLTPHAPRVGRYIEKYRDFFDEDTEFINVPTPMSLEHSLGAHVREARKIRDYYAIGHLAWESVFAKGRS